MIFKKNRKYVESFIVLLDALYLASKVTALLRQDSVYREAANKSST